MALIYFVVALLGAVAVLLLIMALGHIIGRSDIDDRLQAYAVTGTPFDPDGAAKPKLAERANAYINERSFAASIAAGIARAGVKLTVPEYIMLKIGAAAIPFVILALVQQPLLAVLFGAACSLIPDLYLRRRERSRQRKFVQQLPDTLALLVSGLRAGFSLQQAMQNVGREALEPTATEFKRMTQEVQLGIALLQAMDGLAQRIKSDDLDMIISVFKIHSRVGGNLAHILETVAFTIRERVKLKCEINVITSMQKLSANVLGAMPPILAFVIFVINPSYMREIFQLNIYLCLPVSGFTLAFLGYIVLRRMADIKV